MKLRTKLIVLLTGFAFIPISIFGVYIAFSDHARQISQGDVVLIEEGKEVAAQVEQFLTLSVLDLEFLSSSSAGKRLLMAFEEEDLDNVELEGSLLKEMLVTFFKSRESFKEVLLIQQSGQPFLKIKQTKGKAQVEQPNLDSVPQQIQKAIPHLIEGAPGEMMGWWDIGQSGNRYWIATPVVAGETRALLLAQVGMGSILAALKSKELVLRFNGVKQWVDLRPEEIKGEPLPSPSSLENEKVYESKLARYGTIDFSSPMLPSLKAELLHFHSKAELFKPIIDNLISIFAFCVLATLLALVVGFVVGNRINRKVSQVMGDLLNASDQVTGASSEISHVATELSDGASTQAASLEETSAVMGGLAGQAKNNAKASQRASEAVFGMEQLIQASIVNTTKILEVSKSANETSREGVDSMQKIREAIFEIQGSSDKISDIIEVINEITHQTKMLATNAAIEAARAGEEGKGFAVVADEVSKLAENSKTAAKEIAALIKDSVSRSKKGSEYAQEGVVVLEKVYNSSQEVDRLVGQIADNSRLEGTDIKQLGGLAKEIESASLDQADRVTQVTNSVGEIDVITQSNASTAEAAASASEELNAQAEILRQMIYNFADYFGVKMEDLVAGPEELSYPPAE